jgi:hypothetical protein
MMKMFCAYSVEAAALKVPSMFQQEQVASVSRPNLLMKTRIRLEVYFSSTVSFNTRKGSPFAVSVRRFGIVIISSKDFGFMG